jgi:hypothetical protein
MGVSYRQAKRLWSRYQAAGDGGVVHGLRGRVSNRGVSAADRERVLGLYTEKYGDFGPTLASEYLEQEDGLCVPRETLRRWLKEAGLWSVHRRRAVHRQWRRPKDHSGEMVQMDGSHHDWFEGRRAFDGVLQVSWTVQLLNSARSIAPRTRRVSGSRARNDGGHGCSNSRTPTAPGPLPGCRRIHPAPAPASHSRSTIP